MLPEAPRGSKGLLLPLLLVPISPQAMFAMMQQASQSPLVLGMDFKRIQIEVLATKDSLHWGLP